MIDHLLRPGLPRVHLLEASTGALDALRLDLGAAEPTAVVRAVRGRKARTTAALLDELAAALQLPLYFGGNWDALADVLGDLPPAPHVLLLADAAELLADDPAQLATLFAVLGDAHADRPFHAVVQERPGVVALVERRLRSAGVAFDRLTRG